MKSNPQELMLRLLMRGPTFTTMELIDEATPETSGHHQITLGYVERVDGRLLYDGHALAPETRLRLTAKGIDVARNGGT